jgi:tetratricopeptide (TPR) repeat protein
MAFDADRYAQLVAERNRVSSKLESSTDKDVRRALEAHLLNLAGEILALEAEKPPEARSPDAAVEQAPEPSPEPEEAEFVPPTPAQIEAADKLIALSRVEGMRGNKQRATELLQEAAQAAPGAPSVQELLGDDLAARKRFKEAREAYRIGLKADPKNVGLERKYAETVLKGGGAMSIDEQMRMNLSDSPFLNPDDQVASAKAATIINLFAPGLGQIVSGRTVTGLLILGCWGLCVFFIFLMKQDLQNLISGVFGRGGKSGSGMVLFPMLGALALHLGALMNSASKAKSKAPARIHVDRPTPPVNLPFE